MHYIDQAKISADDMSVDIASNFLIDVPIRSSSLINKYRSSLRHSSTHYYLDSVLLMKHYLTQRSKFEMIKTMNQSNLRYVASRCRFKYLSSIVQTRSYSFRRCLHMMADLIYLFDVCLRGKE